MAAMARQTPSPLLLLLLTCTPQGCRCDWDEWWTYDGISGPTYWGVINPAWSLCSHGRHQSPVDVDPGKLVFDRTLRPLSVDKRAASGVLANTGQSLLFRVADGTGLGDATLLGRGVRDPPVNITGGPLAYRYQFESLYVHWGAGKSKGRGGGGGGGGSLDRRDAGGGSEHSVAGRFFPAEVQLMGFNSELFANLSEALGHPNGVVGIAVMVQQHHREVNPALRTIAQQLTKVTYRGQSSLLHSLMICELLPDTEGLMTYEGSSTRPGCEEGVTWVIMNRPIYVSSLEMAQLRMLWQGQREHPKSPVGSPNARPPQQVNGRTVRTNLSVEPSGHQSGVAGGGTRKERRKRCPDMDRQMAYRPNDGWD